MLIGYARTSTLDQTAGLEGQDRDLRAAGCERMYVEQVSSVDLPNRVKLTEALDFAREGHTLVITKLDRLARSVAHLLEILAKLESKGASLRILNMGIDTATPTGKLMLTVLGAVGAFEREIMLERQREGIAKAKADGKYKGRVPTDMKQDDQIRALAAEGMTKKAIAEKLKVSERSVYRAIEPKVKVASN